MSQQTPKNRVLFVRSLLLALLVFFGVFISIALSLRAPARIYAATSNTLNFQARLEMANGAIAPDGNYNVQFKLYGALTGGTALWTETYQNSATQGIRVANGYLTANLGSVTAFPTTINWDQQLWVTMNIGGTTTGASPTYDGEMSPRLQLTAVPYAFRAAQLAQYNSATGFTSSLQLLQPTGGNQLFQIPDQGTAGTFNLLTTNAAAAGFIQNGTGLQTGANFNIDGTGKAAAFNAASFDTGSSGTLSIGTTNATTITIGKASQSVVLPGSLQLNGTTTGVSAKVAVYGALNSTGTGFQYGIQNSVDFTPQGASVSAIVGTVSTANIAGSSVAVGSLVGTSTGVSTGAGYTGTVTSAIGLSVNSPAINGTNTFANYTGVQINNNTVNGGNTSGSITNSQLYIGGTTGAAASGGTVNNYGINLIQPAGAGAGTTNNYGLYIQGNGAGPNNYSIYNGSTAASYYAGSITSAGIISANALLAGSLDTAAAGALTLGGTNATSVNIANNTIAHTINIASGAALQTVTIGSTNGASATTIQGGTGNVNLATNSASASVIVKSNTNSANAFQIQGASATLLNADTTNNRVSIGTAGTAAGQLYVSGSTPAAAVGSVVTAGSNPYGIAVQGKYAYRANFGNATLSITDISNPASPVVVGSVGVGAQPAYVAVQGRYAYVTTSTGLYIVDVSNPVAPVLIGGFGTTGAVGVAISGRYAYVTENTGGGQLQVVDISNPYIPKAVGLAAASSSPYEITIQGRYAYVANYGSNSIQIFDINNPSSPIPTGTISTGSGSNPTYIVVAGRYAYTANFSGSTLGVYDISNPAVSCASGCAVGSVATGTGPFGLYIQGRYAYTGNYGSGTVSIINIANPASPTIAGTINAGGAVAGLYIQGRYAYVDVAGSASLAIYDIGGEYAQQLEAGGITTGTLNVDTNASVNGTLSVGSGLNVNGGLQLAGGLSTQGNIILQTTADSAAALQILNSSNTSVLAVNTSTNAVTIAGLATPTNVSAVPSTTGGSLAAATYFYKITAIDSAGGETLPSSEASATTTGTTSKVTVTWTPVAGATSYRVYRGGYTNGQTGYYTTANASYVDTGAGGTAATPPVASTAGTIHASNIGLTIQPASNSTATFQVQNAAGTSLLTVDTFNSQVAINGNLTVAGTIQQGNAFPVYKYTTAGQADTSWKTIATVNALAGPYAGAAFEVDVVDSNSNVGGFAQQTPLKFFASALRSGGTADDTDAGSVSGPVADYVQVVKTSNSTYELQVRQTVAYRVVNFTAQVTSLYNTTVSYVNTPANGSTGTTYSASLQHTDVFTNAAVNGNFNVAGNSTFTGTINAASGISSAYNGAQTYENLYSTANTTGSVTGTFELVLPANAQSTMLSYTIEGYDYTGKTWQATVGGFIASNAWYAPAAQINGSAPFTSIRLGYNTSLGRPVLLLGGVSTSWYFPQISVTKLIAGYVNVGLWGTGYTSAFLTSETALSNVVAPVVQQTATTSQVFVQGGNSFGAGAVLGTSDSNSLSLITGGTTRFSIDASGNGNFVGNLNIGGAIQSSAGTSTQLNFTNAGAATFVSQNATAATVVIQAQTGQSGDLLDFKNNGFTVAGISSGGSLFSGAQYITGTTTSTTNGYDSLIGLKATDGQIGAIYHSSNGVQSTIGIQAYSVGAASQTSIILQQYGGSVGIGLANPSYALDVNGDINSAASVRTAGTIRLDSTGNLTNIGSITASGNFLTTGTATVKTTNASAFSIQNASAVALLNADTVNNRISIGSVGTPSGQLYVSGQLPNFVALNSDSNLNNPQQIAVQGQYAYVVSQNNSKLDVYDISTGTPVYAGQNSDSNLNNPTGIAIAGKYAYVGSQTGNKLVVYDISSGLPVYAGQNSDSNLNSPTFVTINGKYAIVSNEGSNKLVSYDISSGLPVYAGQNSDTNLNKPRTLINRGQYVYVANANGSKLSVYNIVAGIPTFVGSNSDSNLNGAQSFTISGKYAYVLSYYGNKVLTYDISGITPVYAGQNSDTNLLQSQAITAQGRYVYIASGNSSKIAVYDITSGTTPVYVGVNTDSGNLQAPSFLAVSGRFIYASSSSNSKLVSYDLGGAYIQQVQTGGLETTSLNVDADSTFAGSLSAQGGVSIGQSLQVNRGLGVGGDAVVTGNFLTTGTATVKNTSTTALSLQNAGGTQVLGLDTANGALLITSTGNSTIALKITDSSGNVAFVVDAVNKFVGINTGTPGTNLSVNGGNNINPSYPDGLVGTPLFTSATLNTSVTTVYTVPAGKTTYLTNVFVNKSSGSGVCSLSIGSTTIISGSTSQSFSSPLILPSGTVISGTCTISSNGSATLNGLVVTQNVTSLFTNVSLTTANTTVYTVPAGKTMYLMNIFVANTGGSGVCSLSIGSTTIISGSTSQSFSSPLILPSGTVISGTCTISSTGNGSLNGYVTNSNGLGGP